MEPRRIGRTSPLGDLLLLPRVNQSVSLKPIQQLLRLVDGEVEKCGQLLGGERAMLLEEGQGAALELGHGVERRRAANGRSSSLPRALRANCPPKPLELLVPPHRL